VLRTGDRPVLSDLSVLPREPRILGNSIGSLNIAQLEANVRGASTPLPEDVWRQFEERFPVSNTRRAEISPHERTKL